MSHLKKLAIRGVRSFGPNEEEAIEFMTPLTLILGQNGSGKTVRPRDVHVADHHRVPKGDECGSDAAEQRGRKEVCARPEARGGARDQGVD